MAIKAKHAEQNNGKDIIAQSHHATVLSTQKRVRPLHTVRKSVYGEKHCPSSAKQTWQKYDRTTHLHCDCRIMLDIEITAISLVAS